jgi:hypothetical protein
VSKGTSLSSLECPTGYSWAHSSIRWCSGFWKTLQGVGKACYCLDEHRVLKSFIVLDSSRIKQLRIFLPSTNRRPGTNRKPGLRSINTRTSDKFTIGYPTETPNPNVTTLPAPSQQTLYEWYKIKTSSRRHSALKPTIHLSVLTTKNSQYSTHS